MTCIYGNWARSTLEVGPCLARGVAARARQCLEVRVRHNRHSLSQITGSSIGFQDAEDVTVGQLTERGCGPGSFVSLMFPILDTCSGYGCGSGKERLSTF